MPVFCSDTEPNTYRLDDTSC
ncbi:hypothetical protein PSCLAVI8L_130325 [Pseudoclavibacter sp. 8L]|nr:hypothetical protein PSCLAVI8L_130325 [Pseudoclavibacter sp. 8L]